MTNKIEFIKKKFDENKNFEKQKSEFINSIKYDNKNQRNDLDYRIEKKVYIFIKLFQIIWKKVI